MTADDSPQMPAVLCHSCDAQHALVDRQTELNDKFADNLTAFLDGINRFEATVAKLGTLADHLRIVPLPTPPWADPNSDAA
jgi:hypothetical protein